jgi:effector-binding domain-containing protein
MRPSVILHIGVKTLDPQLVAYKALKPGDGDTEAFAELNAELHTKGAKPTDPTMIIYYDPKETPGCRREVMIGVDRTVEGVPTKKLPKIKAAFIVYAGTKNIGHYYEELTTYMESRGLKQAGGFCSIEAIYQPDQYGLSYGSFIDEDAQETWTTEILIPVEG